MVLVRIMAGLGNQMFQYALYRRLFELGKDVYLDITSYEKKSIHNNYELNKLFYVRERLASEKQIQKVRRFMYEMNLYQRALRKVCLMTGLPWKHVKEINFGKYNPEILRLKGDYYIDGNWQSEKYFKPVEHIIRKEFVFKPEPDKKNQQLINEIKQTNAISIHVRCGDYINNPLHGNICTIDYYKKALNLIKEKTEQPKFYIFSDDPDWAKAHLKLPSATYVDWNKGENSFRDMQLMSYCNHHIIANSSFSWWGAWLNPNPDKIVIAPATWLNGNYNTPDVVPDNWIKI